MSALSVALEFQQNLLELMPIEVELGRKLEVFFDATLGEHEAWGSPGTEVVLVKASTEGQHLYYAVTADDQRLLLIREQLYERFISHPFPNEWSRVQETSSLIGVVTLPQASKAVLELLVKNTFKEMT